MHGMIKRKKKLKWRRLCGGEGGVGGWRRRRLMTNNLTPTIWRGVKREEQQIQIININNRKDNNNTFNSSYINHILLSYHKVFSLDGVSVIFLCHCPGLWNSSSSLLSSAPVSSTFIIIIVVISFVGVAVALAVAPIDVAHRHYHRPDM